MNDDEERNDGQAWRVLGTNKSLLIVKMYLFLFANNVSESTRSMHGPRMVQHF